jgi:FAD synthetase
MGTSPERQKVVMVFGVFDGLHEGHLFFLRQAKTYGAMLVAVVARDKSAEALKQRLPGEKEGERVRAAGALPFVDKAVLGDRRQGTYGVVKKWLPAVICLGHDQYALERDLQVKMQASILPRIPIVRLAPYTRRSIA